MTPERRAAETAKITNGSLMSALIRMGVPPYAAMNSVTYCGDRIKRDAPDGRPYMLGKNSVKYYVDQEGGTDQ